MKNELLAMGLPVDEPEVVSQMEAIREELETACGVAI